MGNRLSGHEGVQALAIEKRPQVTRSGKKKLSDIKSMKSYCCLTFTQNSGSKDELCYDLERNKTLNQSDLLRQFVVIKLNCNAAY